MTGPSFAPTALAPAPRPAAPPRPPARGAPALKAAEEPASALRVLTYLRLHWLMILFCGSFLGAGLAYAAWSLLPAKYESTALMMVAQNPAGISGGAEAAKGQADFVTYMRTQQKLITSDFVLRHALNDPSYKITDLPTLRGKDDRTTLTWLREKLLIDSTAQLLTIGLEGDRPDDIRSIVDAVKDAYLMEVVAKEKMLKKELRLKVDQAKVTVEGLIRPRLAAKAPAPAVLGGPPPSAAALPAVAPLPGAEAGVKALVPDIVQVSAVAPTGVGAEAFASDNPAVKKSLAQFASTEYFNALIQLRRYPQQIADKKSEVESLKKELEELRRVSATPEALAKVAQDPAVRMAEMEAQQARAEYVNRWQNAENKNAESVRDANQRMTAAAARVEQVRREKLMALEVGRREPKAEAKRDRIAALERDLERLADVEKDDRGRLAALRKQMADLPLDAKSEAEKGPIVDMEKTELLTDDSIYADLVRKSAALKLETEAPDRVQMYQAASIPTPKDPKKQLLATIFAGLLGFGLVGLGVVAAESRAKRVSSLAELATAGQTPVVGVLPWDPTTATDPVRQAELTESIDKLRSYVAQTWLARGATTVAVTSPVGDEGKAFTAFGLAASLASAGYRTLLVDFDLRAPTLHGLAGVENDLGVCELLRGEADPRTTPRPLPSGLHFVPAGRWTEETRSAAVGPRLEAVLRKLRDPFDCVILHAHALLTVAEAVEIARRAEVVLLCTKYRDTRLPLLKRAADRVATLEVPYTGVVYVGATPHEALC